LPLQKRQAAFAFVITCLNQGFGVSQTDQDGMTITEFQPVLRPEEFKVRRPLDLRTASRALSDLRRRAFLPGCPP
jgi:hypothetical protein